MRRIRGERRLKARDIAGLGPGVHEDGAGLRLVVDPTGARRWVLRVTIAGKRRNRGLGPFPLVTLEAARDQAVDIRRAARQGQDLRQTKSVTFRQAFETYFALKRQSLSNERHMKQWPATMETYVFPLIGDRPVASITNSEVLEVLKDVWFEVPVTAKRVLQRMDAVFTSAIVRRQRKEASPCLGVAKELGGRRDAEHHRALPYAEVPSFMQMLRCCRSEPIIKLAFEWLILTATRSGEARGAMWSEVDEAQALWTIPRQRMKTRQEHTVPLSQRCLAILEEARALRPASQLLFPSSRTGRVITDKVFMRLLHDNGVGDRATAHGFRSSFRDWATESSEREVVAEAALAHTVRNKVEAAYRRTTYLDERAGLMERWSAYVA